MLTSPAAHFSPVVQTVKRRRNIGHLTDLGVIVLLVASALTVASFRSEDWWLISPAFIDNWIYWGTGQSFGYVREFFSDTYYFRRWPVTFPYLLANLVGLDGALGLMVLASAQLATLVVAIYFLFRVAVSSRVFSAAATFALLASPATSAHIGNGYYTWPALFFLVVGLTCAIIPVASRLARLVSLFLAGLLGGVSVISYAMMVVFLPALMSATLSKKWPPGTSLLRRGRDTLLLVGVGGLSSIVLDWIVGRLIGATWENFVFSTVETGTGLANSGDWGTSVNELVVNFFSSPMSPLPIFFLGTMLFLYSYRLGRLPLGAAVYAGLSFGPFLLLLVISNMGGNPFFTTHFAVVFFFMVSVASIVVLGDAYNQTKDNAWAFIALTPVALITATILQRQELSPLLAWGLTLILILVLVFGLLRASSHRRLKKLRETKLDRALVFFTALVLGALIASQSYALSRAQGFQLPENFKSSEEFMATVEADLQHLRMIHEQTAGRLWIQDNRPWPGWSPVISSLYGLYSAVSVEREPVSLDCKQVAWILDQAPSTVVQINQQGEGPPIGELIDQMLACDDEIKVLKIDSGLDDIEVIDVSRRE